jgi:hypothetical protein
MMMRGGNSVEENSIGPGALRFDFDNRTSNHHFRQQFNWQFNRDRQESAGGRLAAAAAHSTQADICDCEQAGGRWLAAAPTHSAGFECTRYWVSCLRVS